MDEVIRYEKARISIGDGWILKNIKSDTIFVYREDPNLNKPEKMGKYYKIWIAAPEIKAYAQKEGIFITL